MCIFFTRSVTTMKTSILLKVTKFALNCLIILPMTVPFTWALEQKSYVLKVSADSINKTMSSLAIVYADISGMMIEKSISLHKLIDLKNEMDSVAVDVTKRFRSTQSLLGHWSVCSSSSQCANNCCSSKYSDGLLVCTPLQEQGPIRSIMGPCVDGYTGNGLVIWKCDGTDEQKWIRPSPNDMRLQNNKNGLCMDVSGGSVNTVGAAVILQTCNANSSSQKWMYDGRNVRLQFNTNLCLNIQGGQSYNGAKLIVWSCDDASNNAWLEYSLTATASAGLNGDTTSHLLCPVGSSVINIGGRGGAWVDQIQMTCSDGTVLGPVGGNGGSLLTPSDCVGGYSDATITYGSYIGKVEAFCRGTPSPVTSLGASLCVGCNKITSYVFQAKEKLIGMQVQNGTYVDSLTFIYTERLTATTQTTFHIRSRLNGFFIFGILSVPGPPNNRYLLQVRNRTWIAPSEWTTNAAWSWDSTTNQLSKSGDSGQYCIDYFVTNNPAVMVTNTCAQTAPEPQQRWTYDGNFLQPMTSTSSNPLCASILSSSDDIQYLAVKPCTGGEDQIWDIYYPTAQPTSRTSVRPSSKPSRQPSSKPTRRPTVKPSAKQTKFPTSKPTVKPSRKPSANPTTRPTRKPTVRPSTKPTRKPTAMPTVNPTVRPGGKPTISPTRKPTAHPTGKLSLKPIVKPTARPTMTPTVRPSGKLTIKRSRKPTARPSAKPSAGRTRHPSTPPSTHPSTRPTNRPIAHPSTKPTTGPLIRPDASPSTKPSARRTHYPSTKPSTQSSARPTGITIALPQSKLPSRPLITNHPTIESPNFPTKNPSTRHSKKPSSIRQPQPNTNTSIKPTSKLLAKSSIHPTAKPSMKPTNVVTKIPPPTAVIVGVLMTSILVLGAAIFSARVHRSLDKTMTLDPEIKESIPSPTLEETCDISINDFDGLSMLTDDKEMRVSQVIWPCDISESKISHGAYSMSVVSMDDERNQSLHLADDNYSTLSYPSLNHLYSSNIIGFMCTDDTLDQHEFVRSVNENHSFLTHQEIDQFNFSNGSNEIRDGTNITLSDDEGSSFSYPSSYFPS